MGPSTVDIQRILPIGTKSIRMEREPNIPEIKK